MVIINQLRKLTFSEPKAKEELGPQLLDLPPELVLEILQYLDCKQLLRCARVCNALRAIVRSSHELQYTIELAADGMVDVSNVPIAVADRYRSLVDRRRRWRTLDWVEQKAVRVPGSCQAYELVGGVFAKAASSGAIFGTRRFSATYLPTRDTPERSIVREDLGFATRDFAIDPTQDLVAFVDASHGHAVTNGLKIYLRTLSDNEPHPKARVKELQAQIQFGIGTSFIQIVDDVVGMFYWIEGPGILIWNWLTGELLVKCALPDLPLNTWDFAFLSSRAFMTAVTGRHGWIRVHSYGDAPAEDCQPRVVAMLHLPPVQEGHELQACTTHSGPFVARPPADKVFVVAPHTRIHLLSLLYGERLPRIHMFVMNEFLLSMIAKYGDADPEKPPVQVQWKDWGLDNTRVFEHNVQFQWLRYAHGSRIMLPPAPIVSQDQQPSCLLRVLDFNVHPKRINDPADCLSALEHDGAYDIIEEPSVVPADKLFQEDIVSTLPYAQSTRTMPYVYDGFMIDDERFIGVRGSAFSAGSNMSDLDVYTF